jgi:hypothetical protein
MSKIVNSGSGPIPPDSDQSQPGDWRKEAGLIPNPKASAQRRINAAVLRLVAAYERQDEIAHAPRRKLSKSQKKARRKDTRDIHYTAVQSALKDGAISAERAKNCCLSDKNALKTTHSPGPLPVSCSTCCRFKLGKSGGLLP